MSKERNNNTYIYALLAVIDEYQITEFYELMRYLSDGYGDNCLELVEWCVKNNSFVDTLLVSRKRWVEE